MEADRTLKLIAYLEGTLTSEERQQLMLEIEKNPETREELYKLEELYKALEAENDVEVPSSLKDDFFVVLEEEKMKQKSKQVWLSWGTKIAATITLIAVGVWLGFSLNSGDKHISEQQISELQKEIGKNRQMILSGIDQPAASQRFVAVSASESIQKPDQEIIEALVKVMNTDNNTNVRLAAVRALSRYAREQVVKEELISALLTQSDPLVQVALIEVLVDLGEKRVIPTLERLIKTDTTLETVRDEAYWGVMKLS